MPEIIVFIISLAALFKGADLLGSSAVKIASRLGIPKILIGATLVSVATTLPEIFVSFFSGLDKEPDIAIGTILGSPITNLGLIMGLLFIFGRSEPSKGQFTRTINILIFTSLIVLALLFKGQVGQLDSLLLTVVALVYLFLEFFISKHEEGFIDQIENSLTKVGLYLKDGYEGVKDLGGVILGAFVLAAGANFLVISTVTISSLLNVPEILIAASAIAIGTSLPELATAANSIIYKREAVSIGNLAGASIIDLTLGVSAGAIINPLLVNEKMLFISLGLLLVICFLSLGTVYTKLPTKRVGLFLCGAYLLFLVALMLGGLGTH